MNLGEGQGNREDHSLGNSADEYPGGKVSRDCAEAAVSAVLARHPLRWDPSSRTCGSDALNPTEPPRCTTGKQRALYAPNPFPSPVSQEVYKIPSQYLVIDIHTQRYKYKHAHTHTHIWFSPGGPPPPPLPPYPPPHGIPPPPLWCGWGLVLGF